jgi:surfeit locus 1 family protein
LKGTAPYDMAQRSLTWPTVVTAVGIATLIGLGTWQLNRLAWKESLIAARASRVALPVETLPPVVANPADWTFRRVTVHGTFLFDRTVFVFNRVHAGQAGLGVLTPLARTDEGAGTAVLVDRGWIPASRRAAILAALPSGNDVSVTGVVRLGRAEPGPFVPGNEPARGHWYTVDTDEMGNAIGLRLAPVVIQSEGSATPATDDGPVPSPVEVRLHNPHLGYSLTWYALAVALAAVYGAYVVKHFRREQS